MIAPKIWYMTGQHGPYSIDVLSTADIHRPLEQQDIAEQCAEDFHSNHDGWEVVWPREFVLYETEDGPTLARFEVDMEARPEFSASRLPPAPEE